jgi:hypothetical protein
MIVRLTCLLIGTTSRDVYQSFVIGEFVWNEDNKFVYPLYLTPLL